MKYIKNIRKKQGSILIYRYNTRYIKWGRDINTPQKMLSGGFTLMELIIVMAVLAILVLIATPKLLRYKKEAKLTHIISDTKVVENLIDLHLLKKGELDSGWTNNIKEITTEEISEGKVYDIKGNVSKIEDTKNGPYYTIDKSYLIKEVKTKLPGEFITNTGGKVYYIHNKGINTSGGGQGGGLWRITDIEMGIGGSTNVAVFMEDMNGIKKTILTNNLSGFDIGAGEDGGGVYSPDLIKIFDPDDFKLVEIKPKQLIDTDKQTYILTESGDIHAVDLKSKSTTCIYTKGDIDNIVVKNWGNFNTFIVLYKNKSGDTSNDNDCTKYGDIVNYLYFSNIIENDRDQTTGESKSIKTHGPGFTIDNNNLTHYSFTLDGGPKLTEKTIPNVLHAADIGGVLIYEKADNKIYVYDYLSELTKKPSGVPDESKLKQYQKNWRSTLETNDIYATENEIYYIKEGDLESIGLSPDIDLNTLTRYGALSKDKKTVYTIKRGTDNYVIESTELDQPVVGLIGAGNKLGIIRADTLEIQVNKDEETKNYIIPLKTRGLGSANIVDGHVTSFYDKNNYILDGTLHYIDENGVNKTSANNPKSILLVSTDYRPAEHVVYLGNDDIAYTTWESAEEENKEITRKVVINSAILGDEVYNLAVRYSASGAEAKLVKSKVSTGLDESIKITSILSNVGYGTLLEDTNGNRYTYSDKDNKYIVNDDLKEYTTISERVLSKEDYTIVYGITEYSEESGITEHVYDNKLEQNLYTRGAEKIISATDKVVILGKDGKLYAQYHLSSNGD